MAGGFMSGFGPAFSAAFQAGQERTAQEERDNFQYMFKTYLDRKKTMDERDRENSMNIRKAKSLASTYAGGEQNWLPIYRMIASGRDDGEIVKFLQENEMEISPNDQTDGSGPAAPNQDLSGSAQGAVDAQMQQSGMAPPASGGIFGNLRDAFDPAKRADKQANRAYEKMSQITGDTVQDIQKTMSADLTSLDGGPAQMDNFSVKWKPKKQPQEPPKLWEVNSTEEAITAQEYYRRFGTPQEIQIADDLYERNLELERRKIRIRAEVEGKAYTPVGAKLTGPQGEFIRSLVRRVDGQGREFWFDPVTGKEAEANGGSIVPFTKPMQDEIDGMAKEYSKDINDYNAGIEKFKSSVRLSNELVQIASKHPKGESLDISGDVAQFINRVSRNYGAIKSLFFEDLRMDGRLNDNATPARLNAIEKAESEIRSALQQTTDNAEIAALEAGLIDVIVTKLTYMQAAALGQEGRSVTNVEYDNIKNSIIAGGNPEVMRQGLARNLQEQYTAIKDREILINQATPVISEFERKYEMKSPFRPAMPVDELIESDPEFKTIFENMTASAQTTPSVDPNIPPAPEGIDPEDWKFMTEEERKLWQAD